MQRFYKICDDEFSLYLPLLMAQSVLCSKRYTFKLAMDNGIELEDLLFDDPDPHSGDPVNSLREIERLPFNALTLVVN
jgi:hypothetical protein